MRMSNEVNEKSRSSLVPWKVGPKPNLKVRDPRGGQPSGGFQNLPNTRQQIQFRGDGNHGRGGRGQKGGGDRQGQLTEWFFLSCNVRNFETRSDCRRCRTGKSQDRWCHPTSSKSVDPRSLGVNVVVPPQGPVGFPDTGKAQGRQ
jgi:hypothetical protein